MNPIIVIAIIIIWLYILSVTKRAKLHGASCGEVLDCL